MEELKKLDFGIKKSCSRSIVKASLNHLGKKCFAFSSLDKSNIPGILAKV